MQRILDELKKDLPYLLLGLLPLLFLAGILFLKDPLIWSDEAIYVDTAKGFLQTGTLASSLFGDAVYGLKTIAAWYPPLYFYLLGIWVKLFGSSIESVRSLSLVLASLALINIYYIAKLLFQKRSLALLAMVLIATDYFFGRGSRVARMDILNFCLLTYSYWFYLKSQIGSKYMLFSGIFAGLALISHPLGLIGIVLISLHLVLTTGDWSLLFKRLFVFALPILVACVFWTITVNGYWAIFFEQWRLQIERKNLSETYSLTILKDGLIYWRLYFLTLALAFLGQAGVFFVKRKNNDLFLLLGLTLSSLMLISGKELFYLVYYQPFLSLILISFYLKASAKRNLLNYFTQGLIGLLFLTNALLFFKVLDLYGNDNQDYARFGQKIRAELPERATVYLSALPDPYFVLQNSPDLRFLEFPTMYTTDKQYYELLDAADYVVYNTVFDERLTNYLKINQLNTKAITHAPFYDIMVAKLKPTKQRQWPKK